MTSSQRTTERKAGKRERIKAMLKVLLPKQHAVVEKVSK